MKVKLLLPLLCIALYAVGQNTIAIPDIVNYSKLTYQAGSQNWKICQDAQGVIYFANSDGLLSFDGSTWKKNYLPGGQGIRSLAYSEDGRIYVGSQGEIGYFEGDQSGRLKYHSFNKLIPATQKDFTDIWNVVVVGKEVFFRSFKKILHYKDERIIVYDDIAWNFLGKVGGLLITKSFKKGLQYFAAGKWESLLQKDTLPNNIQITAFLPLNKDSNLLITKKHGAYIISGGRLKTFTTPALKMICEKNPYGASYINEEEIVIVTNLGGCYIVNRHGDLIQSIAKQDGLQTNNILSVLVDRDKNLWLGLDNGIAYVAYNNPIKHIYADYQERTSGKTAIIYKNALYIGTAGGLYKTEVSKGGDLGFLPAKFEMLAGSKGPVRNLAEVNGNLLMAHNEGFFQVMNDRAQVIDGSTGFWNFFPIASKNSSMVLAGTYNGVNFYNYANQQYSNPSVHCHFESASNIAIENDIAWASHPYKGLYKIELHGGVHPSYVSYKDPKGILSPNNNHIFKIRGRIILSSNKGLFEYNTIAGEFEPSIYLANMLPKKIFNYLKEDERGNIWFVHDKRVGVVDFTKGTSRTIYFPELTNKIMSGGFEFIYPYNEQNIFIAGEEGFYHLNYERYKNQKITTPLLLRDVRITNKRDSSIYNSSGTALSRGDEEIPSIKYEWNSITFSYSSPLYDKQSSVEYSYWLEDVDKNWSTWSRKTEREYSYLSPGTYTFQIKARTHSGEESSVISYKFIILPPWYRSPWAYVVYILIFAALLYSIHLWQRKKFTHQQLRHEEERKKLEYLNQLQAEKHEEEQKQLMYLHQLERERTEKEIITLKNEKLEAELQLKNTELASTTLNLIQKGEMLVKVKEEFVRMKKVNEVDQESDDYKKIIRLLGEDKMKKNWEQFAVHFDKVHSNFLVTLKSQFPNLTPSELKLCAYLRLNLSSKEIAQIMNISIKSVELARYRLRKKIQVPSEMNLFSFLLNFHSDKES